MDAVALYSRKSEDVHPVGAWMCDKCDTIFNDKDMADKCCVCIHCGKHVKDKTTSHDECFDIASRKDEKESLIEAEKLQKWDGWVYLDINMISNSTHCGYFDSIASLVDHLNYLLGNDQIDLADWPEYAWVAEPSQVAMPDVEEIIEQIRDNGYEGIEDDIDGLPELETALKDFALRNKELFVYWQNDKKAVVIPKPQKEGTQDA